MNKKQKNRKLICQNRRNRLINRHYKSTIKNLLKLLILRLKDICMKTGWTKEEFDNTYLIRNKLYSALDKAVKKGVIHQNTAARKKSKINFLYQKVIEFLFGKK